MAIGRGQYEDWKVSESWRLLSRFTLRTFYNNWTKSDGNTIFFLEGFMEIWRRHNLIAVQFPIKSELLLKIAVT